MHEETRQVCLAGMPMGRRKPRSKPELQVVELSFDELMAIMERLETEELKDGDCKTLAKVVLAYCQLLETLRNKDHSLARLRKLLFGARTEKTENVLPKEPDPAPDPASNDQQEDPEGDDSDNPAGEESSKGNRKGHGRNGAEDYPGAEKVSVPHESLQPGDPCPECGDGKLYDTGRPGVLIRIVGQAPLQATVYQLQKLRCTLCGKLFTAQEPDGVGPQKYDATSGSVIALLKYGSGFPFNRLQGRQENFGIPLPASTQWEIVHAKAEVIEPAHHELVRQAAQGDVLFSDDTNNRILELMGERARKAAALEEEQSAEDPAGKDSKKSQRTGLFTTGVVSQCGDRQIAVFFTGRQHAGENLGDVLRQRAGGLESPIQMSDALSRNIPDEFQTILANCLAHGRRNFVDVVDYFPEECRYVLEALKEVYKNDGETRKQKLSSEARLLFHQTHSQPIMDELHKWLNRQIDERRVEPNSGLGQAISYMLKHWPKLTLFLRKAGAPLDNNVCERALKKAILHRKNSYFFKTQNGARVADLYMSLIYTCELNGINAFDYLTELERHGDQLAVHPEQWMPWNYRDTLEAMAASTASSAESIDSPLDRSDAEFARQR